MGPDKKMLLILVRMRMPFGKHKGKLLCDLPEDYLIWFKHKEFPKGKLGEYMANVLEIPLMMLLTAVSRVAINFGKPDEQALEQVSLSEIKQLLADGHFPPGSMGPKINAAIRFIEGGGERVIIAHLNEAMPALNGELGTHIVADALCS